MVSQQFGVDSRDLTRRGRHGNRGREAAVLLARELTMQRLDDLGQLFGGISRSGVSELLRRAENRTSREPEFGALVKKLKRELD